MNAVGCILGFWQLTLLDIVVYLWNFNMFFYSCPFILLQRLRTHDKSHVMSVSFLPIYMWKKDIQNPSAHITLFVLDIWLTHCKLQVHVCLSAVLNICTKARFSRQQSFAFQAKNCNFFRPELLQRLWIFTREIYHHRKSVETTVFVSKLKSKIFTTRAGPFKVVRNKKFLHHLFNLVFEDKMAYIIPPRRDKSSQRMKRKAFLKEGEDSCMKMSSVATQWTALSSAAVKSSKRHVASQSNSELQTFLDTFPNEIQENEKFLLKMIDEAWQRKDVDAMFQLIKVSDL